MPVLRQGGLVSVLCDEPFVKASFLERIIKESDSPIYIDFDLLYSGLVSAGFLSDIKLDLYRPGLEDLYESLESVLEKMSHKSSTVIIDSLNGFYNIFDSKDAGRIINSCIMLLGLVARQSGSQVILASVARLVNDSWVTISGRRVITSKSITDIRLDRDGSSILVSLPGEEPVRI